ncbi:aldose reductase [Dimargaris cristalligena]|uniref:Aldose reductase n=1 Tax=Dimargaris cristalligena TaxID=215637 RepID=A0A4P9ZUV5_9FUNG|nr:aldose reductase [Dimargaris cristalligena]|eukprot:RKP36691.1 aldose reductase [Dimargaris cristalligena]
MSLSPTIELSSGAHMPAVGFGTGHISRADITEVIQAAVRLGYRHIDGALSYGGEDLIGAALAQPGGPPRSELWLTSKLMQTQYRSDEQVAACCQKSLQNLQTDYLDLYLMHWPVVLQSDPKDPTGHTPYRHPSTGYFAADHQSGVDLVDTWRSMEELVMAGKVRHIGVSNFNIRQLKAILAVARIRPAVNQVEVHPYCPNKWLVEFCRDQRIHVTAYSPLGAHGQPRVLDNPTLSEVEVSADITPAQVVLTWARQRGLSVIPKASSPSRMVENLNTSRKLTPDQMDQINAIPTRMRVYDYHEEWGLAPGTLFGDSDVDESADDPSHNDNH